MDRRGGVSRLKLHAQHLDIKHSAELESLRVVLVDESFVQERREQADFRTASRKASLLSHILSSPF
jgi:hypothetical protein